MRSLLDVNVLIALLDRQHAAHAQAHQWLANNLVDGWASCPLTENGCLRIMTNPRYPAPVNPVNLLAKLDTAKASAHHEFWPDDLSVTDTASFNRSEIRNHHQVTDLYLLALAVKRGGRLVTFDQGIAFSSVIGVKADNLVIL